MGYYINSAGGKTLEATGKAISLIKNENAKFLVKSPFKIPTNGDGLVCVVNNGMFEAAVFIYSNDELEAFNYPDDYRPKTWLTMPLEKCKELSGYSL